MTDIKREARRLALEVLPDYLKPPFNEAKVAQFFLATQELEYDSKKVLLELEGESENVLERKATQVMDELIEKDTHVKNLFTKNWFPEYAAAMYERRTTSHFGGDDVWGLMGYDSPKLIKWNATLKDPHPDSNLKFKLQSWLDCCEWWPHWDG